MKTYLHKKVIILLLFNIYLFYQNAFAQCGAGFTSSVINFDMHYFSTAALPAGPLEFAIGKNSMRFARSGGASNTLTGINGTHTGSTGSYSTGNDMEFSVRNGADTLVFNHEVSNLRFSVFDVDNRQILRVNAFNALGVPVNVGISRVASGTLTIVGNGTLLGTATADADVRGNNETQGTVNITIAGPVKRVILTFTKSTSGNDPIWISDILACNNNATVGTWAVGYQAVATPEMGQPAYMIGSYGDSIVAVDLTNNLVELIYEVGNTNLIDTLFAPAINSLAYDPNNQIVYFADNARTPRNKSIFKYDIKTGIKSTWIDNVEDFGIQLFGNGMGSGGASFYDGALYIGQDMLFDNEPVAVYRIDIDAATGDPIGAYRVWSKLGKTGGSSLYDWADFIINDGVFYNFNSSASRVVNTGIEHINLNTQGVTAGYSLTTNIIVGSQSGIAYDGTIYHMHDSSYQVYNNAGGLSPRVTFSGVQTRALTDAAEAFKYPYDYGDAPLSYGLVYHLFDVTPNLTIGTAVDFEMASESNPTADADDVKNTGSINDEDGISSFPLISVANASYTVPVRVSNSTGSTATLYGYIDFNRDGDFDDAGEQSAAATVPNGTTIATPINVLFTGLSGGTVGASFIRFRLASDATEAANRMGRALSGEVEDYPISITAFSLPVELVDIKATVTANKSVEISWTTASEFNNDFFDVQRKSQDGTTWETIGQVDGFGNSRQAISYVFMDTKPFSGENYYRLNQVDFDGSSEYSPTVMAKLESVKIEKESSYTLFPNPAKSEIWIKADENNNEAKNTPVDIYTITGEKILSETLQSQIQRLDLTAYQNGMYLIKIGSKTFRILKE